MAYSVKDKDGKGMSRVGPIDNRGVTLVELMIAVLILLFISMALMQTALLSIEFNTKNSLRDEAVRVAEAQIDSVRNTEFDSIAAGVTNTTATSDIRTMSRNFDVSTSVTDLSSSSKQVDVTVQWDWKGVTYSHAISTVVLE